jgi:carboxypeptidase C (cathepsin A)
MTRTARLAGIAMILLASSALAIASASVTPPAPGAAADAADAKPVPEPKVWVTRHKARIGGTTVAYSATAGTLLMKNDKGEPIALFGFTAYTRDDTDPATRPIVFAFNGGPGSASAWLHMGILGPKRTDLTDLESNTRGPFHTVENEYSILDRADLVMLDPVGTGLSRAVGKGEGKDFWGVDQDIQSVSNFIVRYLGDYGRWASPKFVLGESYGGMRAAGVAYTLLTDHDVSLNGLILVSPYLDLASGWAGLGDVGYVNFLPTYAATAWYHGALGNRPAELQPFLREAEAFAEGVYAPVLFKGTRATAAERQAVLDGLARYTGVSADYWDKANLRLDEPRFLQELLRSKGEVVGRVDSRYVGGDISRIAETMKYDPYGTAVGPAIVATFNDYYRRELKVDSDREYVLSGDLEKDWDNRHEQPDMGGSKVPYPNTIVDLSQAITMNPKMKVLVQQGYFDLACPYRTVEYALDHLDVGPALRGNVSIEYYDAGHMMYVHPGSMQKFKRVLAAFIDANAGGTAAAGPARR